ncbi:hypothetical protein [Maribellus mangrovi]|uniref:hypothetical protein n=1 Tax=Maribellus mangrovi TaxID=3133146 RepID=UPI0030ED5594
MSNNEERTIKPFEMERICTSHPNIEQLTLKEVETTESVYTRTLVQLKDASLPDVVLYDPIEQMSMGVVSWDLFAMLKYRQDWKPSGYGLGELLYAVSLMPNEELTLEMKTWETSKTQQDEEDTTDERNVSDIKTATSNTNEVTSGNESKTHEYVDAKAGYSGFGFSASVAAGWSQDVSTMQKDFAKTSQDRSQQATNEYRATHKTKMTVSRESGSESKTTRKIKNINQAHTLNVNYFEILREYEIKLTFYEAVLVLLGAEANLNQATDYYTWDQQPQQKIKLGSLIRGMNSREWIQAFTDYHGVSPVKILREYWSAPLYDAALIDVDWTQFNIVPEAKESFRDTVLQFVRPTPGWVEPDQTGALRWAYEVVPGQENALLNYLYGFLPFSVKQIVGQAMLTGLDYMAAYQSVLNRFEEATLPSITPRLNQMPKPTTGDRLLSRTLKGAAPLKIDKTSQILVTGPFYGKKLAEVKELIPNWVNGIVEQLDRVKSTVGVIQVDGQDTWKTTLPSQAIYSDLALGICSGAEDFYEVQRQFDLELKKLQIEKLQVEVDKLTLEKTMLEQGKNVSSVIVSNPPEQSSLTLDVNVGSTPTKVEFNKTE